MPARLSSMEISDPVTPDLDSNSSATNRRKSTRTRQKPVLLQEDLNTTRPSDNSNKRKRTELRDGASSDNRNNISDDESRTAESDGDPDEEELRERRRKISRTKKIQTKPSAKKPKVSNAMTKTKLAVRPAVNGTKKISKPKNSTTRSKDGTPDNGVGLYGMCFHFMSYASQT